MIRLPIDIKSLHLNIKNDNKKGHTATVATPVRQGGSTHKELAQISRIPENISQNSKEEFISQLIEKSRAQVIIPEVHIFDKIKVNGIDIETNCSYCLYIREETDPANVHYGRQKVHYPNTLRFSGEDVEIDNKTIINLVSNKLKDYSFLVEAFEFDETENSLNFDALIVGEKGIPYSKVFLNKKGVGNKFTAAFGEAADAYDTEIIAMREHLGYEAVSPDNYPEIRNENKFKSIDLVVNALNNSENATNIRALSEEYPYTLYDIMYSEDGIKKYVIVRNTSTKLHYFNLPYNKMKFCMDFPDLVRIALVTDINGVPELTWYSISDLNMMNKTINSITYEMRK